jgi:hypothetical protein
MYLTRPWLATCSATLESVSCAAPGDCTAGGGYIETASVDQPFVVSESAGTWTSAEEVSGVSSGFVQTVACPDEADCTVAGIAWRRLPHREGGSADRRYHDLHDHPEQGHRPLRAGQLPGNSDYNSSPPASKTLKVLK